MLVFGLWHWCHVCHTIGKHPCERLLLNSMVRPAGETILRSFAEIPSGLAAFLILRVVNFFRTKCSVTFENEKVVGRGVSLVSEQRAEDNCTELKCLIKVFTMSAALVTVFPSQLIELID